MSAIEVEVLAGRTLVITVDNRLSTADVSRYLDAMTVLLDSGEPFSMITDYRAGRPRKDAEGHRLEREWLAEHRPRLRGVLVAVALVHHSGPLRRAVERVAMSAAGRRLFGCPCRPFSELDDALTWIRRLQP